MGKLVRLAANRLMKNLLLVFLGGGLGSVMRYLLSAYTLRLLPTSAFPLATLLANLTGCFLFGLMAAHLPNQESRYLLLTGFCGGFTTFSTFAAENIHLWQQQQYLLLASYLILSITLGLAALALGISLGK